MTVVLGVPTVLPSRPSAASFRVSRAGSACGCGAHRCFGVRAFWFSLLCCQKPRWSGFPLRRHAWTIVPQVILRDDFPRDFSSLGFVTFSHPTVISLVKNVKS